MKSHFFAYIARLRYIRRWGLMRSSMSENDAEHSTHLRYALSESAALTIWWS